MYMGVGESDKERYPMTSREAAAASSENETVTLILAQFTANLVRGEVGQLTIVESSVAFAAKAGQCKLILSWGASQYKTP